MNGGTNRCLVCDKASGSKAYCLRCDRLLGRDKQLTPEARKARLDSMHKQWDAGQDAFICRYTGVTLNHSEGSAWHGEWEHEVPDHDTSLVLVASVVNRMKQNLTLAQFKEMIAALHAHLNEAKEPFDEFAFPLNWQPKRLAVPEVRGPTGRPL